MDIFKTTGKCTALIRYGLFQGASPSPHVRPYDLHPAAQDHGICCSLWESLCAHVRPLRSDSGGPVLSLCPRPWNLWRGIMFHNRADFFQRWFYNLNRAVLILGRALARMYVFVSGPCDIIHTERGQWRRPDARHSSSAPLRILLLPVNAASTLCWVEKYRLCSDAQMQSRNMESALCCGAFHFWPFSDSLWQNAWLFF